MKKLFLLSILIFLLANQGFGQDHLLNYTQGITPMHKFFQQYTDSTVIVEYANAPDGKPSKYAILSKTDNYVNTFNYEPIDTAYYPLYTMKTSFPVILWNVIGIKRSAFKKTPPDINIFFNILQIPADTARKIWQGISKLNIGSLVDDRTFGHGCKGIVDNFANDGGSPKIIHFITKTEIKTLIFKSPNYYEKLCPGNKNRQAINQINELFNKYFPPFKGRD